MPFDDEGLEPLPLDAAAKVKPPAMVVLLFLAALWVLALAFLGSVVAHTAVRLAMLGWKLV